MAIYVDDIVVSESATFARFTVRLTAPSAQTVTVGYNNGNLTAANGSDYTAQTGTLTFAPGQTELTIDIPILNGTVAEFTESFVLNLFNPTNSTISKSVGMATIIDNDSAAGTPTLLLADKVVDEAAGTVSFVITLDRPSTGVVSVNVATASGTAAAGADFTALAVQTLTFAAGEVSKTVTVNLINDTATETGEFFDLVLSAPVGANLPDTTARVFIGASDQTAQTTPVISVAHATAGEGQGYIEFVVSLSGPSVNPVSVNYSVSNASAANGVDYTATSGTLGFEAGETVKTVRVALVSDATLEPLDNLFFSLGAPSGASLGNDVAIGTIVDNDATAGTPLIKLGDVVVDEKAGRAYLTVTLDRPSTGTVSVNYATASGTAATGSDFQTQAAQTLSFAAGEMAKTITVNLIDDTAAEPGEFFDVVFSAAAGATLADTTARVFIGASDQPVQTTPIISVAHAVAGEGQGYIDFVVSLSGPSSNPVSVNYSMSNATAANGSDYNAYSGSLVFEAGETVKTVRVGLINDTVLEAAQSLFFVLSAPSGASVGNNVALGTIIDNDATAGTPVIKLGDVVVDEKAGRAYLTVTLDRPSTGAVSVSYATASGTAAGGTDFQSQTAQTLSFAAGETAKTIAVNLLDDTAVEPGEYFDVVFSGAVGATVPDTRARVFIDASDQPVQTTPVITVANAQAGEAQGTIDFVVSLSGPAADAVSVNYSMSNASAANGSDYVAYSGSLLFEAGETVKTVRVALLDDITAEATQNFYLSLSGVSGATIGNNVAIGTLVDNDASAGTPVVRLGDIVIDEQAGRAYVTVALDRPSTGSVNLTYATANGSALAGVDYDAQGARPLSFAAGETSKTIAVNLIDDSAAEGGEFFDVLFSGVVGATLPDTTARIFIGASDQPTQTLPLISVANTQVGEGQGYVDFVVSLSGPSANPVSVNYTTQNSSTGLNGTDYNGYSGSLVFAAGETVKTVRVGLLNEGTAEPIDDFFLILSGQSGAALGNSVAVASIIDNDATAGTPLIRLGDVIVDESAGRAYVSVSLDRPSTGAVSVGYATANGTALAGTDYEAQALQTLSFAAGETSKTIVVNLVNDGTAEGGEFFDVVFSGGVGATLPDTAARVFLAASDEPTQVLPVLSVANAQAGEGQGYIEFVLSLSGPSAQTVSVNYTTQNSTALAGSDYSGHAGSLVFEAGETVKTVRVGLENDATVESVDNLFFILSGNSGASLGNNVAVGTIIDNDATAATPLIQLGDVVVDEKQGRAFVNVTLDRPSTGAVSVNYATANGSAAAGSDYEAQASQTLSFAAGETSKTIVVNLIDDTTAERGEFFDVAFSAAVGATLPDTTARVFLGASDQPAQVLPVLSVANAQAGEGQGTMEFVVSLGGPSSQPVSVNYTTQNSSALNGSDYSGHAGSLVFEAGETVKTVRVGLENDATVESIENLFFILSGNSGASLGNNVAVGTIIDNDATAGTPVIRVGDAIVDEKDGRAYVTVSLDRPSTGNVSVRYVMSSGTAVAGSDFEAQAAQTLSFAAGETSKTIAVNVYDDTTAEATGEIFDVIFSSPVGATLPDTRAHVVIARNDTAAVNPPTLTVSAPVIVEGGGFVEFVLALSSQSSQPASVNYTTVNATAANGSDYEGQSGNLVFEAGETVKVVRIGMLNNAVAESAEAFTLSLSGAVGVTLGTATVNATIVDDDPAPAGGVSMTGSTGPDILRGLATADTLNGSAGNDVLDGGDGADNLAGGTADDVYIVETGDTVTELAGAGNDTVLSYLSSYTLGANVENLVLGSGAITAIGNALNNRVTGNASNNTLDGGDGADVIDGAGGLDTVTYAASSAAVTADLTTNTGLGGSAQGDTFANVENLRGSAFDDTLTGNALANTLDGGAGNDTLIGRAGADALTGGTGLDTFVFSDLASIDAVADFSAVDDTFRIDMSGILIGNGNTTVDGGVVRAAPGGFATSAELVVFTTDIVGTITAANAAAQIGSATSAYAVGADVLFAVDNGTQTGLFVFQSAGADALVSDSELTQIALVNGSVTALPDYTFGP